MIDYFNPFEYEAANKLSEDKVSEFYIEDYNYSRFIRSKRNIFLVGARGTGKTMTLRYNSLPVKAHVAQKNNTDVELSHICIHVPCNTVLTHKRDYEFFNDFHASIVSEHFLVISIMYHIVDSLEKVPNLLDDTEITELVGELEYSFDTKLPDTRNFFTKLKLYINKENRLTQERLNADSGNLSKDFYLTFSSGVLPLVLCLKNIPKLNNTHFSLMLDDAHDLNVHQIRTVNSWIAYRDNSNFSFKVAMANMEKPSQITRSGGTILEGHDFTQIDMDQPYQNKYSLFGKLARRIIKSRLMKADIQVDPENFFPINESFKKDLLKYNKEAEKEAIIKYGEDKKKIGDYIYKYGRAKYFKSRQRSKSNHPPYSGFDMLVHLSTGVIRNLLDPCYWMFDRVVSEQRSNKKLIKDIKFIPPVHQRDVILERSKKKWEWIESGLDNSIEGCTTEDCKRIYQLFDQLAILFRERLIHHKSEPRAVTFSISETQDKNFEKLDRLLSVAQKAQVLYSYRSSAKDSGRRETYYVPNRILWPERGLDPHGQHARVSIKARDLWAAANNNKRIPTGVNTSERDYKNAKQPRLPNT